MAVLAIVLAVHRCLLVVLVTALLVAGCGESVRSSDGGGQQEIQPFTASFESWVTQAGHGEPRGSILQLAVRSWDDWMLRRWPEDEGPADLGDGGPPVGCRWPSGSSGRCSSPGIPGTHRAPRTDALGPQDRLAAYASATSLTADDQMAQEYAATPTRRR